MKAMIWNPDNLVEYAKDRSIKECANKYDCSYGTMSSYMYRHISTLYRYLVSEKSLEKAIDKFQRRKICVVS